MKLKITSEVDTNVGIRLSNIVGNINANTQKLLTDGTVFCTFEFYADDAAKNLKKSMIFPVDLNTDGSIAKMVSSCSITLTEQEVTGSNLPATIYDKVADKLSSDFGWTVIVE